MSGFVDILDSHVWREESFVDIKAASERTRCLYERAQAVCRRVGQLRLTSIAGGKDADVRALLQISAWTT
jgi:hypothetical protein